MAKRKQPSQRPQAKHKKSHSPSQFDKRERLGSVLRLGDSGWAQGTSVSSAVGLRSGLEI